MQEKHFYILILFLMSIHIINCLYIIFNDIKIYYMNKKRYKMLLNGHDFGGLNEIEAKSYMNDAKDILKNNMVFYGLIIILYIPLLISIIQKLYDKVSILNI